MKIKFNKKYVQIGLIAFFVISANILLYFFIDRFSGFGTWFSTFFTIISPILYGLIFAFLMTPILNFFEKKLIMPMFIKSKGGIERHKKIIRCISIIITIIVVISFFYGFFALVIPQIIGSIRSIVDMFPTYIKNFENWANELLDSNPTLVKYANSAIDKYSVEIDKFLNDNVLGQMDVMVKNVSMGLIGFIKALWNIIIGFIISIYVLGSKETFAGQSKKAAFAMFKRSNANSIIEGARFINKTFIGFISGKIVDSIIIGCLCFIETSIIGTPYALLVSVIVGVTNIIPFFGPYIGAIPSTLLILLIDPIQALYFVIFVLILQQLDGNVIGPKILGDSTGLSGFWVIFSITLFGGLFGVLGMIIGVPICAILYAGVRLLFNRSLKKKSMPSETKDYIDLDMVEENDVFVMRAKPSDHIGKFSWKKLPFIHFFMKNKDKFSGINLKAKKEEKLEEKPEEKVSNSDISAQNKETTDNEEKADNK